MRLEPLLAAVRDEPPRCGSVRVIAVDGGAAAGKSTLAELLRSALDAALIHTDDVLDGWADQFGYGPRLRAGVLEPLAAGRPGRYRRYNWRQGSFADEVDVPVSPVLIIEGVGSIAACGPALALGVMLTVERAERERRWRARDGLLAEPELAWLTAEEPYLAQLDALASWRPPGWTELSLLRPPIHFPVPARPAQSPPPAETRGR
jgi:hypothetical protein